MHLVPIVEGQGECQAVPALLHRIAQDSGYSGVLRVNPPIRVKAGSFLNDEDYFSKYVRLAGAKAAQGHGSILVLLDCEDDCPARVGPDLLRRVRAVRSDVATLVVLAQREYESWFLSAVRSLRGCSGLAADLDPPPVPERIRDAKGWLSANMEAPYDPVVHQIEFTRTFDLESASANRSFDRLRHRLRSLLTEETLP